MIISEKIKIKVNGKTIAHYKSIGYNVMLGDEIEINTDELNKGSHFKIKVKCDVCGKERDNLMYKEYLSNLKSGGYYSCAGKCSTNKNKNTNLERYGVEHIFQLNYIQDKIKETCLDKYGADSYSKTDKHKEDYKKIMLDKYGVDNPSKSSELQQKKKNIMNERYGVDYYVLSKDFKDKSEKTSLKNYGVDHPMKDRNRVEKMLKARGLDFETDEYKMYRGQVDKHTRRNKKELFENWDGYDYYDNEYIKDNLKLKGQHGDYPTIDHKISVYEGYKNNISPEELAFLCNLCITKRWINSSKNNKSNWIYE